jgi:excisionase family DNA binding protein
MLTVSETAKYLKRGLRQTYALVKTEGFPAIRLEKSIRVPRSALDEWIQKQLAKGLAQ